MRHRILSVLAIALALAGPAFAQDSAITPLRHDLGQRSFVAACSACHYRGAGKTPFGSRGPLSDSSPDELAQYILFGKAPEYDEAGMPAFGPALTDTDVIRLVDWLRSTAKPDAPWADVAASVAAMRATGQRED
jgi:mono/diheme cytochrome c family protein